MDSDTQHNDSAHGDFTRICAHFLPLSWKHSKTLFALGLHHHFKFKCSASGLTTDLLFYVSNR